ncbi:MAG: ACP S-malonyltransferase, partial [Bacteroidales bacterium]|nr:ACP S-malonyltransferase [Bacteroidales bacterium]
LVEDVCASVAAVVVPANYNSPGQIVISGSDEGVDQVIAELKNRNVRKAIKLAVGGAFHSPFMEPARTELAEAINVSPFGKPVCPVYQNVTASPSTDPPAIKANLIAQLTSPVLWTQTVHKMIADGAASFTEVGPGSVLQGLIKKINPDVATGGVVF